MNCGLCAKPVTFVYNGVNQLDDSVNHVVCQNYENALSWADEIIEWLKLSEDINPSIINAFVSKFEKARVITKAAQKGTSSASAGTQGH